MNSAPIVLSTNTHIKAFIWECVVYFKKHIVGYICEICKWASTIEFYVPEMFNCK